MTTIERGRNRIEPPYRNNPESVCTGAVTFSTNTLLFTSALQKVSGSTRNDELMSTGVAGADATSEAKPMVCVKCQSVCKRQCIDQYSILLPLSFFSLSFSFVVCVLFLDTVFVYA